VHGKPDDQVNFSSRPFLESILPQLSFQTDQPRALELGCGTGPGALFLAEHGFQVDGIDLIPTAIEEAQKIAADQGLDIHYAVMDVTQIPNVGTMYALIIDSYCLQGIVLPEDRKKVFAAVRARLKPSGYYLISCCTYEPHRHHPEVQIIDSQTGKIYHRYDEDALFDPETEIYYDLFSRYEKALSDTPTDYEAALEIAGEWYLPRRIYRTPENLKRELEAEGFEVLLQNGESDENAVCVHAGSSVTLRAT
jgi:SAM-dependent methyltransferase